MYSVVSTAILLGIDAKLVSVEADISEGMPVFEMVGYLGSEVREAKERVRTSLKNCGFHMPIKRITINILPADLKKSGNGFDLPIAVALLSAIGVITDARPKEVLVVGELGLNGSVHPINGILPMISCAKKEGMATCIVPMENVAEAKLIYDANIVGVTNLMDVIAFFNDGVIPERFGSSDKAKEEEEYADFSMVNGQPMARMAAEICASGMHNLLMVGPPGGGKTMIAKCIPSILPELLPQEQIELSKIYSVCGLFGERESLMKKRPFRSPHHTVSIAGLTGGGGSVIKPGEISLATYGVLFLDELTEFHNDTLEILRQPMEEKCIHISRAKGDFVYPADFILVAAMNPCKCGYFPDFNRCHCGTRSVKNYLSRISQPLLDRIDLCVRTSEVTFDEMTRAAANESSSVIRSRVERVHQIQKERYKDKSYSYNSQIPVSEMDEVCQLSDEAYEYLKEKYEEANLTARTYHRMLRIGRTVADMRDSKRVELEHIQEAFLFRSMDKMYWEKYL